MNDPKTYDPKIAEMMGWIKSDGVYLVPKDFGVFCKPENLRFSSDLNWLMAAREAIRGKGVCDVDIQGGGVYLYRYGHQKESWEIGEDIKAALYAAVCKVVDLMEEEG